jgi:hypothetical protein
MTRTSVIEEKIKIEQSIDNRKQKRIAEIITQTLTRHQTIYLKRLKKTHFS